MKSMYNFDIKALKNYKFQLYAMRNIYSNTTEVGEAIETGRTTQRQARTAVTFTGLLLISLLFEFLVDFLYRNEALGDSHVKYAKPIRLSFSIVFWVITILMFCLIEGQHQYVADYMTATDDTILQSQLQILQRYGDVTWRFVLIITTLLVIAGCECAWHVI